MTNSDVSLSNPDTCWRDENSRSIGYFTKLPVSAVSDRLLNELKSEALSAGENARLSLHQGPDDAGTHEMFIVQLRDRVHPPKKHDHKAKSFHVIEGEMAVFAFDADGAVIDFKILGQDGNRYYRVEKGVFHADMAITDHVIHHETTEGPFLGDADCIWAEWAPARDDMTSLLAYRDELFSNHVNAHISAGAAVVTGAAGLAGSVIANELAAGTEKVAAIVRTRDDRVGQLADSVEVIESELSSLTALPSDAGAIVHAAARLGVGDYSAVEISWDNVDATRHLIELAVRAKSQRFIFMSAMSVYGSVEAPAVSETTPIINPDAYGLSKLLGEQMLAEHADHLPSVSLRLPSIVGSRAKHGWMTGILGRLNANEAVELVNPDTPFNNVVHVEDLAHFISQLCTTDWSGAEVLCLSAGEPMPLLAAVEYLRDKLNSDSTIRTRVDEDRTGFSIDSGKAEGLFGWQASPVKTVLDRLAEETIRSR